MEPGHVERDGEARAIDVELVRAEPLVVKRHVDERAPPRVDGEPALGDHEGGDDRLLAPVRPPARRPKVAERERPAEALLAHDDALGVQIGPHGVGWHAVPQQQSGQQVRHLQTVEEVATRRGLSRLDVDPNTATVLTASGVAQQVDAQGVVSPARPSWRAYRVAATRSGDAGKAPVTLDATWTSEDNSEATVHTRHTTQPGKSSPTATQTRSLSRPQTDFDRSAPADLATVIEMAASGPQSLSGAEILRLHRAYGNRALGQLFAREVLPPAAAEPHSATRRLPSTLRDSITSMSGVSLEDVRVHYNSEKPAQLDAAAYTQGSDIYVATRQEGHLAHEAWHVVQQAQGRVVPNSHVDGVSLNDNERLEHEAELMGEHARRPALAGAHAQLGVAPTRVDGFPGVGNSLRSATVIQRKLIDEKDLGEFQAADYQYLHQKGYEKVVEAFKSYLELVKSSTQRFAGDPGDNFYLQLGGRVTALAKEIKALLENKHVKTLDNRRLETLVSRDIPDTMELALRLRNNFPAYAGAPWTFFGAMAALRGRERKPAVDLESYRKAESGWASLTPAEQTFLRSQQANNAGTVEKIRSIAQEMLRKGGEPREVLEYISREGTAFVTRVVQDAIAQSQMTGEALAVLSTGSFGSGELFPYSDVDIQLLTTPSRVDPARDTKLEQLLNHIRVRIRMATLKNLGADEWIVTKGWDVDQLVQSAFDVKSAVAMDKLMGLGYTTVLHATSTGGGIGSELQSEYAARGQATVKQMMGELYPKIKQGSWCLKNPENLEPDPQLTAAEARKRLIEFKETFMRLPRVLLNVLATHYGLQAQNSWQRVAELVEKKSISKKQGKAFMAYLDLVTEVRLRYQFFYQQEGLDVVSPNPGVEPKNPATFPKGYYVLNADDRKCLMQAQQLQTTLIEVMEQTKAII